MALWLLGIEVRPGVARATELVANNLFYLFGIVVIGLSLYGIIVSVYHNAGKLGSPALVCNVVSMDNSICFYIVHAVWLAQNKIWPQV